MVVRIANENISAKKRLRCDLHLPYIFLYMFLQRSFKNKVFKYFVKYLLGFFWQKYNLMLLFVFLRKLQSSTSGN